MDNVDENPFWPITCQKLFYDDHTIVNSMLDVKSDMKFGNYLKKLIIYFVLLLCYTSVYVTAVNNITFFC